MVGGLEALVSGTGAAGASTVVSSSSRMISSGFCLVDDAVSQSPVLAW